MKIVFLVSHLKNGGAERTVSYLSKYLANRDDFDVTILSMTDDVFYEIDSKVNFVSLNIESNGKNIFKRIRNIFKRQMAVKKYIKNASPDVVFCMMVMTAKLLISSYGANKYKLITSERINPESINDSNVLKLRYKLFAKSDGIVFQTQRAKNFYPKEFQDKGIVIHNAMGNDLVYKVPEIIERKKKISAIGRLSDQKDYPTLIKAFAKVLITHSDYVLEIFGDGPEENNLRNIVAEMGLTDKVFFKGSHRDAILQAADSACYVMSSLYEGMPNALMEAMGAGIPCVSTDCPNGPAELINNGENGILVPVGNADELATAILKMIDDRCFAEKCSKNAKNILQTNNVDVISKKYADFIVNVVNKGNDNV